MRFEILWSPEAFESIDHIFEAAQDQAQIAAAIRNLDQELSSEPGTQGESRPGGLRIVFSPPLGALVEIQWRLNQVIIGQVWQFEQHSRGG